MYWDQIHHKLLLNEVRNKILLGCLKRDEHDLKEVYNFLKILKSHSQIDQSPEYNPITVNEQTAVVKKAKRISILSVFLKEMYTAYKYLLESKIFIKMIVR